ncbi:MAG: YihY/virulence factor BrkB family protein [Dehalococcoidia bacterium]
MGGFVTLCKRSFQSFGSDKCSTLAAAIAYNTVFALFPIALFGVAVLGFLLGGESARQHVVDGITKVIPLGDTGAQALSKTLKGASAAKGWLSIIGVITAAWGASGLFGNIRQALDSVWDVDRPLPMLRAKARDLMLFIVFGGLLLASTASTGFLQGARNAGGSLLGPVVHLAAPLFVLLTLLVPMVITFAAFMFLYRKAPHVRLGWGDVWPAAVIAALFFTFGTNILTFYITHMGGFNALAGSLGAAILFLVFVYYASQVILLGAEFSKHRMLVLSGAVPATDPKTEAPAIPLGTKVKGMLVRLWVVEEPHHEHDLPYHPGRMDPVNNEPTNTKEEVLFNIEQSREQAEEDAARANKPAAGNADAQSRPVPNYRHPTSPGSNFLWKGFGYLIALLLSAVVKKRERSIAKTAEQQATHAKQPSTGKIRILHR